MLTTIVRNSDEVDVLNKRLRIMQIALSLIKILIVFGISDSIREGLFINGLVLGYAITGTIVVFFPFKTIYLNKTQK